MHRLEDWSIWSPFGMAQRGSYRIQSEKCSLEIGEIWKVMVSYKNNKNNSDETLPFPLKFCYKTAISIHTWWKPSSVKRTERKTVHRLAPLFCYGIFGHGRCSNHRGSRISSPPIPVIQSAVNQLEGLASTAPIASWKVLWKKSPPFKSLPSKPVGFFICIHTRDTL